MSSAQSAISPQVGRALNGQRLAGFIRKEWLQIIRDPSSIIVAVVLPLILLFIFGYGVSLDAKNQPIAIVFETSAPEARDFLASMQATRYLVPHIAAHRPEATQWLRQGTVKAIVLFGSDFGTRLHGSAVPDMSGRGLRPAPIQVIVNATDANTARLLAGYVQGAWATWLISREHARPGSQVTPVNVEFRVWFNEELDSHKSIVPGLVAVIMTLIGALLTTLVIAREWERGTMEALLTTPLTRAELLIGKLIGITATMMPAVLLSGFIFDIRSMPKFIQLITYIFPARYFVDILKTLFLAGNIWAVLLPNLAALTVMAGFFITLTVAKTRRTLD
jgi:ABC-2 type transport system permease protein